MDFVRYAERSAGLVNAGLDDTEQLLGFLDDRRWLHDSVVDKDAAALRRFVKELRPVFEASNAGDERAVVDQLNPLLAKPPAPPSIPGRGPAAGGERWHMHVAARQPSVAELLVAESLMGLSPLVCALGATRLGVC